ncbi:MAG: glycosyltransferase [Lachnospiraceae bacterium]|jgi:glycosyltransferase involved in cell wall biosynthesis|nr:glycosyltransferase [Lachnospiraceae bacterium]
MIKNKEKNFASAVAYIHNNEASVFDFLQKIDAILSVNFEKYEIICVNDASRDDSAGQIKHFAQSASSTVVSILNMSFFQGLELSMNAGIDLAIGDFVFEFDACDPHLPLDLMMDLYQTSLTGYDIVSAAPESRSRLFSRIFYSIFNRASHLNLRTETFRILSRRAINRVQSMSLTIPYRKAVYANCGLKTSVLTYSSASSAVSDSDHRHNQRELALDALILYTNIAYKFCITLSLIMMMIAIFVVLYASYFYFVAGGTVEGWTTTILFLAFSFFGLFAILTTVIKYLSILLNLVFKKQKYIIESIEKYNK